MRRNHKFKGNKCVNCGVEDRYTHHRKEFLVDGIWTYKRPNCFHAPLNSDKVVIAITDEKIIAKIKEWLEQKAHIHKMIRDGRINEIKSEVVIYFKKPL
jgi:hypothetical protein